MYYFFDAENDDWREKSEAVLCEKAGTLHLIDSDTGQKEEMEILFMYTQLLYNGYYSDGIARVGDDLGLVHIFLGPLRETRVMFKKNNDLYDIELFDKYVRYITAEGVEMVRNSEAIEI